MTLGIGEKHKQIMQKVMAASAISEEPNRQIHLIAVSKTMPVERIREAMDAGLTDFGENKVQELTHKMSMLDDGVKWHMIGHLQRNKVKYIIDKVALIHSVDTISLFEEINRRGQAVNRRIDCLIQVNVSGEHSKYGIHPQKTDVMLKEIERLAMVKVRGLMTMAPHYKDPEKTRDCFKRLSELYRSCKSKRYPWTDFQSLSMGMSNDYEIAVQEGSNMIRIGSALFGERDYG